MMLAEQQAYISPGTSLALTCLKHWLRDLDRKFYPDFKEVDELVRSISYRVDRLYYSDGERPSITEELLEDTIEAAVPWLCWPRFGMIHWGGFTLFRRSLEIEALYGSKEGGCSAGMTAPKNFFWLSHRVGVLLLRDDPDLAPKNAPKKGTVTFHNEAGKQKR